MDEIRERESEIHALIRVFVLAVLALALAPQ
jgi:hypothetical protein